MPYRDMNLINQIIEKNKDKILFNDETNESLVAWILGQYIAEDLRPDNEFQKHRGSTLVTRTVKWDEREREECEKLICIALAYFKLENNL